MPDITEPTTTSKLCPSCCLPIQAVNLSDGQRADCPRCGKTVYQKSRIKLSGNLALAVTCLLLLIPAHYYHFITINLFGVTISASLLSGITALSQSGFVSLALLVLFCSSVAPLAVCIAVVCTHFALHFRWFTLLKRSLWVIRQLKYWVMIDVFLVSVAIACFKLQDYASIFIGTGLIALIILQVLTVLLLCRIDVLQYWNTWQEEAELEHTHLSSICTHCQLTQPLGHRCLRCKSKMTPEKQFSLQKPWAYLITAGVAIFPANLIPISILTTNGNRTEDTIFSGVVSLVDHDLYGIAVIIFIASILVPFLKIVGLAYILISVHGSNAFLPHISMRVHSLLKWIGKWSMVDLFVISIMLTLVDRGQLLHFTPGLGAVAFAVVVVCSILATESINPQVIWKNLDQRHEERA